MQAETPDQSKAASTHFFSYIVVLLFQEGQQNVQKWHVIKESA